MLFTAEKIPEDRLLSAVQKTGNFWNAQVSSVEGLGACPMLTEEALYRQFSVPPLNADFHYIPTILSSGKFVFMPFSWNAGWKALENTLAETASRAVLGVLPTLSQLDPLVTSFFRQKRIFGTVTAPGNLPLALELIRQLQVDLLLATPKTAAALFLAGGLAGISSVRAAHMIVGPDDYGDSAGYLGLVCKDFHPVPGLSVARQCKVLAKEKGVRFHPSPDFVWESIGDAVFATSIDERPAPLLRMRACTGTLEEQACPCGATLILSLYGK